MFNRSFFLAAMMLSSVACTMGAEEAEAEQSSDDLITTFQTRTTAYYPHNSALEGGFKDRLGKPLRTLQDYLAGNADYVSVAMDTKAFPYGTKLRIPALEEKYGQRIEFRVVDTGGAFRGRGLARMDICVKNYRASIDASVNTTVKVIVDRDTMPAPSPNPEAEEREPQPVPSEGGGASCRADGDCNPETNGAGLICESRVCVPGCRVNNHCPGSAVCRSGQCVR